MNKSEKSACTIMTLDKFDTHDRLLHLKKNDFDIGECCQNLINQRPFGNVPFYIFAHTRTESDGRTKRLIWQPRLTRPKSQTNSMLFKAYPGSDNLKIIWILPARELWGQFTTGLITENQTVVDSIKAFQYNRELLDKKDDDDLTDEKIDAIYRELSASLKSKKEVIKI